MEKIFSFAWRGKRGMTEEEEGGKSDGKAHENYVNDDQGLQRRHNVDTFLQVIQLFRGEARKWERRFGKKYFFLLVVRYHVLFFMK